MDNQCYTYSITIKYAVEMIYTAQPIPKRLEHMSKFFPSKPGVDRNFNLLLLIFWDVISTTKKYLREYNAIDFYLCSIMKNHKKRGADPSFLFEKMV